jgi:hypothetical protein
VDRKVYGSKVTPKLNFKKVNFAVIKLGYRSAGSDGPNVRLLKSDEMRIIQRLLKAIENIQKKEISASQ